MSRITLYERLKPELKKKLETQNLQYEHTIKSIFDNLQTKKLYSELTLTELKTMYAFLDMNSTNVTQSDILYGDNLFKTI
jgi:hypothetical protein